jgi:hypothetical protein
VAAGAHDRSPLGPGALFKTPGLRLPPYIREIAHALMRAGHPKSAAIRLALGTAERWAHGGGKVKASTRAKAAAAIADFHASAAAARAKPNKK